MDSDRKTYCPFFKDECLRKGCKMYDEDRGCSFVAIGRTTDIFFELESLTKAVRGLTKVLKAWSAR